MKAQYKGEPIPKSMLPLIVIIFLSWVVIAGVLIVNCGGGM